MKYKINDIAKIIGVATNTIRRYEKEGYLTPERNSSQYRTYEEKDIYITTVIRLFVKCGFSHTEIKKLFESERSDVIEILDGGLRELDDKIERLKFLRHWLKDNVNLMRSAENLGSDFKIRERGIDMSYVIFSKNGELLDEKERLKILNKFLYDIPEVRFMQIFKKEDLLNNKIIPYTAIGVKDSDIVRFDLENEFKESNPYIEKYLGKKCIIGVLEGKIEDVDNYSVENEDYIRFRKKAVKFMLENKFEIKGDVMGVFVSLFGDKYCRWISIPIED